MAAMISNGRLSSDPMRCFYVRQRAHAFEPLLAHCGARTDPNNSPTIESPTQPDIHRPGSSDSAEYGRFLPGTVLTGRYRVCRVYDIARLDGRHFISMEFVDGEDLASLLRRIGRLPDDKAVEIARQLCAGLAAAHDQGVLHRDLKPANVMIDGRGRARIDRLRPRRARLRGMAREAQAGTPHYMAPEQFDGRELSVQTDLYSLGLVLYELFTGKPALHRRLGGGAARAASPAIVHRVVHGIVADGLVGRSRSGDRSHHSALSRSGSAAASRIRAGGVRGAARRRSAGGGAGRGRDAVAGSWWRAPARSASSRRRPPGRCWRRSPWGCWCSRGSRSTFASTRLGAWHAFARRAGQPGRRFSSRSGYGSPRPEMSYGWQLDRDLSIYVRDRESTPDRWERLSAVDAPAVVFWYRHSPRPLVRGRFLRRGSRRSERPAARCLRHDQPEPDARGRLESFPAVPRNWMRSHSKPGNRLERCAVAAASDAARLSAPMRCSRTSSPVRARLDRAAAAEADGLSVSLEATSATASRRLSHRSPMDEAGASIHESRAAGRSFSPSFSPSSAFCSGDAAAGALQPRGKGAATSILHWLERLLPAHDPGWRLLTRASRNTHFCNSRSWL